MTPFKRKALPLSAALLAVLMAGCATVDINQSLGRTNRSEERRVGKEC